MNSIYLERHDHATNMHRFYHLFVVPGLLGDWSLVKEWGRIGSPGTLRKEWFITEEEAIAQAQIIRLAKQKKGYRAKD